MDRKQNQNDSAQAAALLEKLKLDLAQNAQKKQAMEAEAREEAPITGKRYTFRVMGRKEYLSKKQIADKISAAAEDAEVTDEELEALLRHYFASVKEEKSDTDADTAAEPTVAEEAALIEETAAIEESPMIEEIGAPKEIAAVEALDVMEESPTEAAEAAPLFDLDRTLTKEEELFFEEVPMDALTEEEPTLEALTSEDPAEAEMLLTAEMLDDALFEDILNAETDEIAEDAAIAEEAASDDTAEDTDLFEMTSFSVQDEVVDSSVTEGGTTEAVADDDLFAGDLAELLGAISGEEHAEAVEEMGEEAADANAEAELSFDMLGGDMTAEAMDDLSEADLDALVGDLFIEGEDEDDADYIAEGAENEAFAEEFVREYGEPAEAVTEDADEQFDQTDLDLMIAFGMEEQLEEAVGKEEAQKYKEAMGALGKDHDREMHLGDRPDTVFDAHAEYVSSAQNKEIFAEYKKKYSALMFRFLGAAVLLLLFFFFENNNLLGLKLPALFDRTQYPLVYALFDFQFVVLLGAMIGKTLKTGLRAMVRFRPVPESITGFLFLASAVYTAIIVALCPMRDLQMYNFPIALTALLALCYEFMNLRREIMSFKIVSSKKLKYAVDASDPADCDAERAMFAEYISDDPAMFRIKRASFIDGFFRRTETYPRTHKILRTMLPAVLLLVLAFFAVTAVVRGNLYEALTVAYVTLLLILPSSAFIAFSYPMYRASSYAYEKDSAMIGESGLNEYADASVVSFDDKEVFAPQGVRVRNVKVYGNNRIDHVIYAAASVFHVVGGPLSDVFETATGELGYAENVKLVRVDGDGIESRVDGGAVLIGKASFLSRYGYDIALNASELAMEETGDASILFIAYDNNVAAKLYIHYSVDPEFETVLKQLYRQGVCVGIKTSDPNIDDHLLACKIRMSKYPVKIIKCAEPRETAVIVERLSSGIVSKSGAKALLQTLAMCDRVLSTSRTNNVICIVSIVLGVLAMAFAVVAGMPVTLAPIWLALYQLFWVVPMALIAKHYI